MELTIKERAAALFVGKAKVLAGRVKKDVARISGEVTKWNFYRYGVQIPYWRDALAKAEEELDPQYEELQRVYLDLAIDSQVVGAVTQRIQQVLGADFNLHIGEGDNDEELTKRFRSAWFEDFCRLALEAKFYGYTLIEFDGITVDGELSGVSGVKRHYVNPKERIVKRSLGDREGVSVDDDLFRETCILVDTKSLGLYNMVAPYAVMKKNALVFWSQFGELFGSPIRLGKTDIYDTKRFKNLENMLQNMGSNAWAVVHDSDNIQLIESVKTDVYKVFDMLVERAEKSISKIILGQTMTMDDGSSRSQAEVHNDVLKEIIASDKAFLERIVNNELIPRLEALGILPAGVVFSWDNKEKLTISERKDLLDTLLPHYKLSPDTIKEIVDIEVEEKEIPPMLQPGAPGKNNEKDPKETLENKLQIINGLYEGYNN